MAQRSLARRVEILEEKVASLEELPERVARIESQILQFRDENRAEHSAIRAEIRAGDEATRAELHAVADALRSELRADNEETRRHMRVLYEDLVAKVAVLGEDRGPRRRARPSAKASIAPPAGAMAS